MLHCTRKMEGRQAHGKMLNIRQWKPYLWEWLKLKTGHQCWWGCGGSGTHTLPMGMANVAAALGNSLAVSQEVKHTPTIDWPGCPTLVFTQRPETICPQRTVHNNDPHWTRSPNWKWPKCWSTGGLMNKLCHVESTEHYSAVKRNELLKYRTTRLSLKIMLSKRNQTQKTPYCKIPLI